MIELEQVTKHYPGATAPAVDTLSLAIPRGELVVVVGPSGCGKTTLLKMINRIIEPTTGRILVDGLDTVELEAHVLRRQMGYVIQQVGLFPHRTVGDNIATVPRLLGWPAPRIHDRVHELLDLMHLDKGLLTRYPHALSGGQQQRVGVARALAADPPVLLMDEPYGAVDPIVRRRLQEQLRELQDQLRKTVVFVTHDVDEAVLLGDRIAVLGPGGHLAQFDSPDVLLTSPATAFVAAFLGGEPTLRRLSLYSVGDTDLSTPTVAIDAPIGDVQRVAAAAGTDWVAVSDGTRFQGWLPVSDADPAVRAERIRPFAVVLEPTTSLRAALDALLAAPLQAGVVRGREGDVGVLRLAAIVDRLSP